MPQFIWIKLFLVFFILCNTLLHFLQEVTNSNEPMSWSSRVKMGAGGAKPPPAPAAAAQGPPSKEGTPFSQGAAVQGAKPYRGNRGTSQVANLFAYRAWLINNMQ